MVDLRGMPPAYMGNMTFHGVTDPSATKSIAIEESKAGSSLSGGSLSGQLSGQPSGQSRNYYDRTGSDRNGIDRNGSANANSAPEVSKADKQSDKRDENTNAGPPPSFQISILELERDLSSQLARMNAEQSMSRNVQAVSPNSSGSASDGLGRADPRPTREASVPNPMAEPSYANPMAERPDGVERAEKAQDPATQNPATENRAAENPAAQNTATQNTAAQNTAAQNPATQGPAQPELAEGV